MRTHRTSTRLDLDQIAREYLADALPTGRATREATTGALGCALASVIRRKPAAALAAHSATEYAMHGSDACSTDVVVLDERALDIHRRLRGTR